MIIKVLPRKSQSSPSRLIRYILSEKVPFIVTNNLKGDNPKDWAKQIVENESKRIYKNKIRNICTHDIISFASKDLNKINIEMLRDITEKYITFRGRQGIFMASPHLSKNHLHIHFIVGATEVDSGMSMRLSRAEFIMLKKSMEAYQKDKYPELTIVRHGSVQEKQIDREMQLNIRKGKLSRKQILKNILSETLPNTPNLTELKTTLEGQGIKIYERGGKIYGVEYEGRNHRFDNLGFSEQINELEKREVILQERFNELEEITQQREGKEIKIKEYLDKEIELDLVAEGLLEYNVSEKEVGYAEVQPASDKLTPTD